MSMEALKSTLCNLSLAAPFVCFQGERELYGCLVVVLIDSFPSGAVLFIDLKPLVLTDQNNTGLGILHAAKSW